MGPRCSSGRRPELGSLGRREGGSVPEDEPTNESDEGADGVAAVGRALAAHGYLADDGLATAVFLALHLERPLLLEGEAGVGKTEVAKVLDRCTGGELIRLQCYE